MKPVTAKQIDAILPFLERFEEAGFSAGTKDPPWFTYDEAVSAFMQVLYANAWIAPEFDWMAEEWHGVASEYEASPAKVESADLATVQKLFTTHLRNDYFCDGHLASLFENGHIVALLRRVKEIRKTMPDPADR